MQRLICTLTSEAFAPYGLVLDLPPETTTGFYPLLTMPEASGWTWAISKQNERQIDRLGAHPNTRETFEPLSGVTLIAVAPPDMPEAFEVFLLDRPVVVFEHVWHAICALSDVSCVKIVENAIVTGELHTLSAPYRPMMA